MTPQPEKPQTLNDYLGGRKDPERQAAQTERTAAPTADADDAPAQTPAKPAAEAKEPREKEPEAGNGSSAEQPVDGGNGTRNPFVRWVKNRLVSISNKFESADDGDDII